jgi:hypothetical protein
MLKTLLLFALTLSVTCAAQDTPKTIALTDKSDVPGENISKSLRKHCWIVMNVVRVAPPLAQASTMGNGRVMASG